MNNGQNTNNELDRKKYESKYNIYHDKKDINKKSNIVVAIIGIILLLIILIICFS